MKKFIVILFAALTFSSAMAGSTGSNGGTTQPDGSKVAWAG